MAAEDLTRFAPGRAPRKPISSPQIEVVISRSVALSGLVFAGQAVQPLLEQSVGILPIWTSVVVVAIFGGLIAAVIASSLKRGVDSVNGFIAFSWVFGMSTWPIAVIDESIVAEDRPWPWFLLTVATAAAAVAWPVWVATLTLFVCPLLYAVVRITPSGGADAVGLVALDVLYAILLGGTALVIITLLRQAAASVDLAQATAIDRYSNAVRQHATEVERVEVDAIVHDSVLTTFLSAARADTPAARSLAGRMADNAMGYLRDAATSAPDDTSTVSSTVLADRIRLAAAGLPVRFALRRQPLPELEIPAHSAEALYSAAVQAMVNSSQHAGTAANVRRWLTVGTSSSGGLMIEVGDTGEGFDPAVLSARIGLRVSIVERTTSTGGDVEVDAKAGVGAVIRLRWPGTARNSIDAEESPASELLSEPTRRPASREAAP